MAYITLGSHNHTGDYATTNNEQYYQSNGSLYAAGIHNPALENYNTSLNY